MIFKNILAGEKENAGDLDIPEDLNSAAYEGGEGFGYKCRTLTALY